MSGGGWDADPTAERARVVDLIRTAHLMMGPAVVGLLIVDSAIRDRVVVGGGLLYLAAGAVALATLTGRRLLLGLGLLDLGLIAAVASTSPATFTVLLVPAAAAVSVGWYAGPLVTGALLGSAAVSMGIAAVMAHVPSGLLAVAVMTVTGAGLARSNLRFVDDRRASVLAARELVESLPVIVWESDLATGEVTRVMGDVEGLLGFDERTWCTLPAGGRVHPDDLARGHWIDEDSAPPPGVPHLREFRLRRADGTFMPAREIVRVVEVDGRRVLRGVTLDVTAEADARTAVERYAAVIDHQRDPVVVVERDGGDPVVVHANRAFAALVGGDGQAAGRSLAEVAPWLPAALRDDLARAGRLHFERRDVELDTPAGSGIYDIEAVGLPDGASALLLRDVTERRRAAEAIRHQAFHDALTSLPNRSLLFDRLRHALASLGRGRRSVGLLLADLDQFKEVNDTLGHAYGDRLLQTIGARLADAARDGDTVARLGGDEFAVVVTDVDLEGLGVVAERIAACIREIIRLDGLDIEVGVSIGGVLAPDHGRDPHVLLQRADIAMYEAKRAGASYRPYTPDRDPHSRDRLVLMGEIRRLFTDELEVWFQPKVDLRTRRVPGVEALARWRHRRLGLLGPERFIELCEMSGAVSELTFGVLDRALAAAGDWGVEIAVNVPVRNLYDRALPERVLEVLARHGVEPGRLVLEITEREIMEDHRTILEVLAELHDAGIRLSVDDFGTGYSSLTHLRRLPLAEIKIDRAFVAGMLDNENDYIIARSIIDLAHNLGHRVVAEGVEDAATATLLEQLGCDLAQGFLFARPGPAARIGPLVTAGGSLEMRELGAPDDTRADTG
ncbi:MAG: EAL domain-containing protein [Actinomyces sp.]|nr:MAG: EAL domain-containing protein [Actinomyces sp.]